MSADVALLIIVSSLWAGLFSAALAIIFSAPTQSLWRCFVAGFAGYLVRCAMLASGSTLDLASLVAAALVVLVAVALVRRANVSPAVMVSALLPLGSAGALFRVLYDFLRLSRLPENQLDDVSQDLVVNISRVFTGTLALAIGVSAALLLVRFVMRRHAP